MYLEIQKSLLRKTIYLRKFNKTFFLIEHLLHTCFVFLYRIRAVGMANDLL